MNVKNCRGCGRLFNYVSGPFMCPSCREKMEEKFQEVKEFIRANPGVHIHEISEACDVDPNQIRQWLREDRLEVTEDSPLFLNCEGCGASIRSGRYCDKCKNMLATGFNNVLNANKPKAPVEKTKREKESPKMRFLS